MQLDVKDINEFMKFDFSDFFEFSDFLDPGPVWEVSDMELLIPEVWDLYIFFWYNPCCGPKKY